jgi:hypothetical protein
MSAKLFDCEDVMLQILDYLTLEDALILRHVSIELLRLIQIRTHRQTDRQPPQRRDSCRCNKNNYVHKKKSLILIN